MKQQFQEFVQSLIRDRYDGTSQRLAAAMDMSLSAFLRAVNQQGTLSVENCLKLAKCTDQDPSLVLRLAGKDDIARLIEDLYGQNGDDPQLRGAELTLVLTYRLLSAQLQGALWTVMKALPHDDTEQLAPVGTLNHKEQS